MLHVSIEGQWSALDFAEYFAAVDQVYSVFALIEIERRSAREMERLFKGAVKFSPDQFRFMEGLMFRGLNSPAYISSRDGGQLDASAYKNPAALLSNDEKLRVRRCTYASPGATDFTGLGQALGHLKDIIFKCIEVSTSSQERKLTNEILKEKYNGEVLKNLKDRIEILKSVGYSDVQCRRILSKVSPSVAKLESLANRGLVVDVSDDRADG